MAEHTCHAIGCEKRTQPRMFMCGRHWAMLPKVHKDAIWANYVPGQERRKDPSPEYLAAAMEAINALFEIEQAA